MSALVERRDREIQAARVKVGKARQTLHRYEAALANLEEYWTQHPAEAIR